MSTSDDHGVLGGPESIDLSPHDLSRYDLVLAVIPLAFVLGVFASGLLSVSMQVGMAMASALGGVAVLDALFVNPPEVPSDPGE